jgi:hypothetical protein
MYKNVQTLRNRKYTTMWVHKLVQEIVEKINIEVQKPENQNVFQMHVLDPIIQYALGRLYPYILATSIVFFLTFVLAVAILFLLLTHKS